MFWYKICSSVTLHSKTGVLAGNGVKSFLMGGCGFILKLFVLLHFTQHPIEKLTNSYPDSAVFLKKYQKCTIRKRA